MLVVCIGGDDPCEDDYVSMAYPQCSDNCENPNLSAEYIEDFGELNALDLLLIIISYINIRICISI